MLTLLASREECERPGTRVTLGSVIRELGHTERFLPHPLDANLTQAQQDAITHKLRWLPVWMCGEKAGLTVSGLR
jgi:hypothetical protein